MSTHRDALRANRSARGDDRLAAQQSAKIYRGPALDVEADAAAAVEGSQAKSVDRVLVTISNPANAPGTWCGVRAPRPGGGRGVERAPAGAHGTGCQAPCDHSITWVDIGCRVCDAR